LEAERWRLQYVDGLIKNDVWHLEGIMDFRALNTLIELLKNAVGSTISYTNLAQDLQVAPNTVKKYIEVLESAYLIFKVTPYSKNIARALLKEPKIYFYDYPLVSDAGARLENFVAVSLLKEVLARQDYGAQAASLHYIRTKDGKEVDFCICMGSEVEKIIEVKSSDSHIQPNLRYFSKRYGWPGLQLVADLKREYVEENIEVRQLDKVLQGYF
jgi:predicted AAA+ superfamily ATPase